MKSIKVVHHGRNTRKVREILEKKQEEIAELMGISQPAYSKLEAKEEIDDETLEKLANALGLKSINALKNFDDEATIQFIDNTFNTHDNDNVNFGHQHSFTFNYGDKYIEALEKLVSEKDKEIARLRGKE